MTGQLSAVDFVCHVSLAGGVVTMTMGAKTHVAAAPIVVAGRRIVIQALMSGQRLGRAGGGVGDGSDEKGGDDQGQHRRNPRQSRHRPDHSSAS
jgi:hypothetical protein